MKKFSTLLLAAALVAGLATGCKKKEEAPAEPPAQEQQQELPAGDQQQAENQDGGGDAAGDDSDQDSDEDEGAGQVDEAMFVKAAYEVSCVKAKVDNPEEQKEILEVIYPRYGFETVEEYQAAETTFKDSPSVKAALDDKMKNCTSVDVARGFKTAGAEEQPAADDAAAAEQKPAEGDQKDDKEKPAAPKAAYKDGTFSGTYSGTGIKLGRINCTAARGDLNCALSGSAEGKGFSLPAKGKVSSNGRFNVSGEAGGNSVTLQGQLKGTKAVGTVKLNVHKRDYTANFSL